MPSTHGPLERVAEAREERKSSRRRLLGAAAASALIFGGLKLPKAQPVAAQRFGAQQTRVFANYSPIEIPDNSNANPYASPIGVSGMVGGIIQISVTIYGFNHTHPDDVEIMLVNPTSVGKVVMAGVGGALAVSGADLVITDTAATHMPNATLLTTGNYKPTNHLETPPPPAVPTAPGTSFGAPAPAPVLGQNFNAFLSLSGANLNGIWRLYVRDNLNNNLFGRISGGWALGIITNIDDPTVRNDSYTVRAGETLTVKKPGVLKNDSDPSGGGLRVANVIRKNTRLGRLVVKRNGSLTFIARRNVAGRVRVNYRAVSNSGLTGTARISIRVRR